MPVCGDDAEARNTVQTFDTLIGFDAVDLGELQSSRYLESFAMTWFTLRSSWGMEGTLLSVWSSARLFEPR